MNKTQTLEVRIDPMFAQAIREAAERNEMTVSAYVRKSLLLCLSLKPEHLEAIEVLADISNMTEDMTMAALLTGATREAQAKLTAILEAPEAN